MTVAELQTDSRTLPDLPNKPGATNWVEKAGGLPDFIKRIAKHLVSEQGFTVSRAIATAVSQCKKVCATGRTFGGRTAVSPAARARYCNAVREWETKLGKTRAKAVAAGEVVELTPAMLNSLAEEAAAHLALVAAFEDVDVDEIVREATLTAKKRDSLKKESFALPGRRYPIHDEAHARNALSRVSQHGTPEEKKRVRSAVKKKYPSLGESAEPDSRLLAIEAVLDDAALIEAVDRPAWRDAPLAEIAAAPAEPRDVVAESMYLVDEPANDALGRAARNVRGGSLYLGAGIGAEKTGEDKYAVTKDGKAVGTAPGPLSAATLAFKLAGGARTEGTPGGKTSIARPESAARIRELDQAEQSARSALARSEKRTAVAGPGLMGGPPAADSYEARQAQRARDVLARVRSERRGLLREEEVLAEAFDEARHPRGHGGKWVPKVGDKATYHHSMLGKDVNVTVHRPPDNRGHMVVKLPSGDKRRVPAGVVAKGHTGETDKSLGPSGTIDPPISTAKDGPGADTIDKPIAGPSTRPEVGKASGRGLNYWHDDELRALAKQPDRKPNGDVNKAPGYARVELRRRAKHGVVPGVRSSVAKRG